MPGLPAHALARQALLLCAAAMPGHALANQELAEPWCLLEPCMLTQTPMQH